jgi:hypothetical protein
MHAGCYTSNYNVINRPFVLPHPYIHNLNHKVLRIRFYACAVSTAKGPDAQGLANSVSKMMDDFGLEIKTLRTAIKDRAATNQAAVNLMPAHHGIQLFAGDCNAHTLSHVPGRSKIPFFELLRKQWGKAIQHGCNCPMRFREIFGEAPKKGGGVRLYVYWEQCVQVHHVGLVKLHDLAINHCIEMKWAEKACRKFAAAAAKPDVLARALVECCAASSASAGKAFWVLVLVLLGNFLKNTP